MLAPTARLAVDAGASVHGVQRGLKGATVKAGAKVGANSTILPDLTIAAGVAGEVAGFPYCQN